MSGLVLFITGVCYAIGAIDQASKGDWGHALMFAGYTAANIGLYFAVS